MANKKTKSKNRKDKSNKKIIIAVIGIAILLFVAGVVYLSVNKILTAKEEKRLAEEKLAQENYLDWLVDNCECVEKNRYFCNEGFALEGETCVNHDAGSFTRRLIGCSRYNCSEEIIEFNFEENKWNIPEEFN